MKDANECFAGWLFYVPSCFDKKNDDYDYDDLELDSLGFEQIQISVEDGINEVNPYVNVNETITPNNLINHINNYNENSDNAAIPRRIIENILEEGLIKPSINIAPNPVYKSVRILINFPIAIEYNIKIINSFGQVVQNIVDYDFSNYFDKTVDVNKLQAGVYYILVNTKQNSYRKKMIVIH